MLWGHYGDFIYPCNFDFDNIFLKNFNGMNNTFAKIEKKHIHNIHVCFAPGMDCHNRGGGGAADIWVSPEVIKKSLQQAAPGPVQGVGGKDL